MTSKRDQIFRLFIFFKKYLLLWNSGSKMLKHADEKKIDANSRKDVESPQVPFTAAPLVVFLALDLKDFILLDKTFPHNQSLIR